MKIIYSAIAACFVLLSSACYKDHGNYDYLEPEAITIGGMVSTYTRMSLLDSIIINPEVTSSDPAAEFTYFWGIYETNAQGFIPKLDTIARTKELRYFVTQPAKTWVLVFGATNKHTGVTKTRTANMVVITSFTRGWYVLQDDGTNTDLDMFLTRSAIKPDSAIRNVYSLANNQKLPGRAKYLCFNSSYKTYAAGTTAANTRTLFLFSENELAATNINTLLDVRRLDQLFYGPPATKKPAFFCEASSAQYLQNDGKLHAIGTSSSNIGLFGAAQMRDENNSPYHLSKYFACGGSVYVPLFFDETSSTFLTAVPSAAQLTKWIDAADTEMPAANTNKNLLYMGIKSTGLTAGSHMAVAIMQDKTDPARKLLTKILLPVPNATFTLRIDNDTLPVSSKLYNAQHFGAIFLEENLLYFSVGRDVYTRNLTSGVEQLQFTLPAGEELTFIRHRKYASSTSTEAPYLFNYIMIGSQVNGNYRIRMFQKQSGNLVASPDFMLEGPGKAADVIYISPSVGSSSYVYTY